MSISPLPHVDNGTILDRPRPPGKFVSALCSLAGGRPRALQYLKDERGNFAAMGCFMILVSCLAVVSGGLFLSTSFSLSGLPLLAGACFWGLFILGMDHLFVTMMTEESGKTALALRLTMAVALGVVVSGPIITHAFGADLSVELLNRQEQEKKAFEEDISTRFAEIEPLQATVDAARATLSTRGISLPEEDPQYLAYLDRREAAYQRWQEATAAFDAERSGTGGTFEEGDGPRAKEKKLSEIDAKAAYYTLAGEQEHELAQARARIEDASAQQVTAAERVLSTVPVDGLTSEAVRLEELMKSRDSAVSAFDAAADGSSGHLRQLSALVHVAKENPATGVFAVVVMLTLMFFEISPVINKWSFTRGKGKPYYRLSTYLDRRDLTDAKWEVKALSLARRAALAPSIVASRRVLMDIEDDLLTGGSQGHTAWSDPAEVPVAQASQGSSSTVPPESDDAQGRPETLGTEESPTPATNRISVSDDDADDAHNLDRTTGEAEPAPQTLVTGRFTVLRDLAPSSGAPSSVYLVSDATRPGGRFVLKQYNLPAPSADKALRKVIDAQWRNERNAYELVAGMPQFVALVDSGTPATSGPWLLLEYIDGPTLSNYVHQASDGGRRSMSQLEMLKIAVDVAEGVRALHSVGMFHHDLKPDNIMMDNGTARIIDLGLTRMDHTLGTASIMLQHLGTLYFSAPEFIGRRDGDAVLFPKLCDMYSMGAVLFWMWTGRRPRRLSTDRPDNQIACWKEIAAGTRALAGIDLISPPELADLIKAMLTVDPQERFGHSDADKAAEEAYVLLRQMYLSCPATEVEGPAPSSPRSSDRTMRMPVDYLNAPVPTPMEQDDEHLPLSENLLQSLGRERTLVLPLGRENTLVLPSKRRPSRLLQAIGLRSRRMS